MYNLLRHAAPFFINRELINQSLSCCPVPADDDDGDDPLSSIFSSGPAPAVERAVFQQLPAAEAEPLPSSSSSNSGGVDLPPPPLPRRTSAPSLKRATREGALLVLSRPRARAHAAREFSLPAAAPQRGWRESWRPIISFPKARANRSAPIFFF